MKRKNRPTVLLPIILVLVILVLIFCLNRDYKRLESRRDQIILKINQIKEGADESFVLEILGGPESRESGIAV